jgi:hypothetical protein
MFSAGNPDAWTFLIKVTFLMIWIVFLHHRFHNQLRNNRFLTREVGGWFVAYLIGIAAFSGLLC